MILIKIIYLENTLHFTDLKTEAQIPSSWSQSKRVVELYQN